MIQTTLAWDPQRLMGNENRALESSESSGLQLLSKRLVLPGAPSPPPRTIAERSTTKVIIPSVEHTVETCVLATCAQRNLWRLQRQLFLQINSEAVKEHVSAATLSTSEVSASSTRISNLPANPFNVTFWEADADWSAILSWNTSGVQ